MYLHMCRVARFSASTPHLRHETWDPPSSSRYQGQGNLIIKPPPPSTIIICRPARLDANLHPVTICLVFWGWLLNEPYEGEGKKGQHAHKIYHLKSLEEEDPALFQSTKTGRGPLSPKWKDELRSECPHIWPQSNSTGGVCRPKWRTSSTSKGGFEHGGHQADGRRDPKGARGAA